MSNGSIQSVVVTWKTPYEESVWRRLEGIHSDEQPSDEQAGDLSAEARDFLLLGPSLPTEDEPRVSELFVRPDREDGLLHWSLRVRIAPTTEPPTEVRKRDAEIGGQLGLAKIVTGSIPSGAPPVALFRIMCLVDASLFSCRVLPAALRRGEQHDVALSLGSDARMEQVGYRFEGGANGLMEVVIVYLHRENIFSLQVFASGILRVESGRGKWLPYADDITALVRETFFILEEVKT
jgi:hypothetical protein